MKFFPAYNASLIVMMTLTGMIYYEEYKGLVGYLAWGCFIAGILIVCLGVMILTLRNSTESPGIDQVVPEPVSRDSDAAAADAEAPAEGSEKKEALEKGAAGTEVDPKPRKNSFSIPMGENGKQLAVSALPFVDPRSVTPTGSQPGTPRSTTSPGAVAGGPAPQGKLPPLLPTIMGGETPSSTMRSLSEDEAESLKKALAAQELAAQLQEKLEPHAGGAEAPPPGQPSP